VAAGGCFVFFLQFCFCVFAFFFFLFLFFSSFFFFFFFCFWFWFFFCCFFFLFLFLHCFFFFFFLFFSVFFSFSFIFLVFFFFFFFFFFFLFFCFFFTAIRPTRKAPRVRTLRRGRHAGCAVPGAQPPVGSSGLMATATRERSERWRHRLLPATTATRRIGEDWMSEQITARLRTPPPPRQPRGREFFDTS